MNIIFLKVPSIFKKLNVGNIKILNVNQNSPSIIVNSNNTKSIKNHNYSSFTNNNNNNNKNQVNLVQNKSILSSSSSYKGNNNNNNKLSYTTSSNNNNNNKIEEIVKSTTVSPFTPLNILHPKLVGEKLYSNDNEANNNQKEFKAEISTLPNGIRVVSKQTHEGVCAIGLYINAGTKYESPQDRGVFNLLEKMTFKETKNNSTSEIIKELEEISMNAMASSSREMINVSLEVLRKDLEFVLSILSDQIKSPTYSEEELREQIEVCIRNYEMITNSSSDQLMTEILMGVAFGDAGLGNLVIATPEQYQNITREKLFDALRKYYVGKNIVISVTGAEHSQVIELVDKYFGDIPFTQKDTPSEDSIDSTITYKGGTDACVAGLIHKNHLKSQLQFLIEKQQKLKQQQQQQQPQPQNSNIDDNDNEEELLNLEIEQTKISIEQLELQQVKESSWIIAFPHSGLSTVAENKDIINGLVLQSLLGGGSSYSTGGPGKGMQSRLNLNVVYSSHRVKNCHAFLFVFNKVSLFGISLTTQSGFLQDGIELVLQELLMLRSSMTQQELERAKRSQKSQILQNLEMRSVQCDDMARHILSFGSYKSPEQICKLIDSVTLDDIKKLISKLAQSNPSVVSIVANENEPILTAEQYNQIVKQNSSTLFK
ncbi:mitochondrial processing peptidase alpha subunit [Dictyostelium discoideum AX4]|uniref:Mitochondrial-processing peptidase subunit alpha-1 n=1 Tax=Dictyostelium discoideum TaxID=44689 RepID=MPPA1_DICDI|nr:mitochondrial processing peptidase alpha subunit [Dictyostelium discoideum AX4]Q86A84.1 RecName: Full=Mitochondrial-processing peptidase subunit alpha-1; AltName: Full=Alpha-MPP; Short=Ddalpha-MPP; AltName: Full=Inactive zinc metalloprotease alpha-1; Flags: Precursor [Dictyostelium discoideum]EAS66919.1 mitochondrial processing peptidase alpha subunit [Dictyostelium discoideum AX4]|eukprot:XP_001134603.1 mitochondrial processing peptidase alpha subunit [Dictyostelium discoideum AX4]